MRHWSVRYLVGILGILGLVLSPAFAAPGPNAVIDPGRGIAPALLGMTADILLQALGTADFERENDDGSTTYEWGLLSGDDLPDAVLWVVVDDATVVAKVGTDADQYQTSSGLRVGIPAGEFVKQYGSPANNPGPGLYVFSSGIGIAVDSQGNVAAIWTEPRVDPEF
jgi:hypothetical protein